MRLKKGFLVAIEGIDGAGKTTQAALLHEYLTSRELPAILTKEPTDSIYGQKIKKLAQGERHLVKPREEYNLFIEDRKLHVADLIQPALDKNAIVILDRYYFSTMAYQGAIGLDPARIRPTMKHSARSLNASLSSRCLPPWVLIAYKRVEKRHPTHLKKRTI